MSRLVRAARRYLGVPFRHRGRLPHKLDCVGLVWRAYLDCGVVLPDERTYGREPHIHRFRAAIESALGAPVNREDMRPGDVVTMKTQKHEHHLAIVTDHPEGLGLIHASGEHGCVVEHRLSPEYMQRIVNVYRRPV